MTEYITKKEFDAYKQTMEDTLDMAAAALDNTSQVLDKLIEKLVNKDK